MIPDRYSLENFRRAMAQPSRFLHEGLRLGRTALSYPQNAVFDARHGAGADFMAEDWDNLLLLDACRYDAFAVHNYLEGELDSRISPGTRSWQFIRATFAGRRLHDTVYVSGNSFTHRLGDDVFHAIRPVDLSDLRDRPAYRETIEEMGDFLPEGKSAVVPEDVADATRTAAEQFPEKRLVVHFMQPHHPYIGETGLEIYRRIFDALEDLPRGFEGRHGLHFDWRTVVRSDAVDVDDDLLWEAYVENLELVLGHVEDLLTDLDGRTIISADHGEFIGERNYPFYLKRYGHPGDVRTTELCKVPWFIVDGGERREVTAEEPVDSERLDDESVERHLEALGYR